MLDMDPIRIMRFWDKVDRKNGPNPLGDDDPCHNWTKGLNRYGYGQYRVGDRVIQTHIIAWELVKGEEPKKYDEEGRRLILDHRCRNRRCCNPDHLQLITIGENTFRGARHGAVYFDLAAAS